MHLVSTEELYYTTIYGARTIFRVRARRLEACHTDSILARVYLAFTFLTILRESC